MRNLVRMSELDERGILLNCAKCGRRNRMRYEGLGQVFRVANVNANSSLLLNRSMFSAHVAQT